MVRARVVNKTFGDAYEWEIDGGKYDALVVCGDYVVFPGFKERNACVLIDDDGDLTLIYDDEKSDFDVDDYGIFIRNLKTGWEKISAIYNNHVIEISNFKIKYKWYGNTLIVKVTPIANTCQ